MADIGGGGKFLVEANLEVKILNKETEIQERISRINRLNQDIEDLTQFAIKTKQAEVKMLELELIKLKEQLSVLKPQDADIIDIK
jgi:hypothetical protein